MFGFARSRGPIESSSTTLLVEVLPPKMVEKGSSDSGELVQKESAESEPLIKLAESPKEEIVIGSAPCNVKEEFLNSMPLEEDLPPLVPDLAQSQSDGSTCEDEGFDAKKKEILLQKIKKDPLFYSATTGISYANPWIRAQAEAEFRRQSRKNFIIPKSFLVSLAAGSLLGLCMISMGITETAALIVIFLTIQVMADAICAVFD